MERDLSALQLFANGGEHFNLDEVLRSSCRAFHLDQVFNRSDKDRHASNIHPGRCASERFIAAGTNRCSEAVKISGDRSECEAIAHLQRSRIGNERQITVRAAEFHFQRSKRGGKRFEILAIARVADVEIVRDRCRSPQATGDSTDDHEPDFMFVEDLKYL